MIPVVVLGALYTGYATTVEVSILACIMTIVVAAYYRLLKWKIVWQSALDVVGITAFIYFIFGASTFFVDMLAFAQIPQTLVSYLTTGNLSANALLIWLMVSLFIAGMLMDIIPLVFFIVPLTYQAVSAAGIHYLTYNFLIMQIGAIGFCTPPFAVGIFTMAILFKTPAQTIFKAVWIFIPVLILHMLLFIYWRDGLLWLPHLIFGDSIFG
jgi:TRAP-type C4-dicarboxylate transport system permease large subunit